MNRMMIGVIVHNRARMNNSLEPGLREKWLRLKPERRSLSVVVAGSVHRRCVGGWVTRDSQVAIATSQTPEKYQDAGAGQPENKHEQRSIHNQERSVFSRPAETKPHATHPHPFPPD